MKPNLPVLGKKFGAGVAAIRAGLAPAAAGRSRRRSPPGQVHHRSLATNLSPRTSSSVAQDVEGYAVAVESGFAVAVTTAITPELADEGLAREVVRRIQDMRREAGFELADRITTYYGGDDEIARVMESHGEYIRAETLSTRLIAGVAPEGAHAAEVDLEGVTVTLAVQRNA